jgi:flavin-dependent thymidylate synthase
MFGIYPEPEVILIRYFDNPYDNAVATARTCYSSEVILPEDVSKGKRAQLLRDRIFQGIYQAKHHTPLQHPTFQFVLKKVSRQFIWSFLHSHPFYNSEQVSQRYVEVRDENFLVPPLNDAQRQIYISTIHKQMEAYHKLIGLIKPDITRRYFELFPGRRSMVKRWEGDIIKKVLETARYCLPVATHAHLYHTINALTLFRYYRLCEQFDTPLESRSVVKKMLEEVNKLDPLLLKVIQDPIPLEETLEYRVFYQFKSCADRAVRQELLKDFDDRQGNYRSKVIDYKPLAQQSMASSIRYMLGLTPEELPDAEAIEVVMNPSKNPYLSDTLTLTTISKLSRAMFHPHLTFQKKLSHTADSQNQRHRTTPATRPILLAHYIPDKPEFIVPKVIQQNEPARELLLGLMQEVWSGINHLLEMGVNPEYALYLIPNAFPIRFIESADLLNLHHKWTTRLCYLAQEEIWESSLEEVKQTSDLYPLIGQHIAAPCRLRKLAGKIPYCPEGKRYCGVPVWDLPLKDYVRVI